jgi:hypothetical protein
VAATGQLSAGADDVQVRQRNIGLGQVADLSALPPALRARAAQLTVAEFCAGQTRMRLSFNRTMERARGMMPALQPWVGERAADKIVTIHLFKASSPPKSGSAPCLQSQRFVPAGSVAAADDFTQASCPAGAVRRPFAYHSYSRAFYLARDVTAGEIIGGPPLAELARVLPGQKLYITAKIGNVRVDRVVEAVQPAARSQGLFVRGADGTAFSAPGPEVEP